MSKKIAFEMGLMFQISIFGGGRGQELVIEWEHFH